MSIKFKELLFIVAISAAVIVFFNCGSKSNSQAKEEKEEETGIPVETTKVIQGSVTATYTGSTTLEAEAEAVVVAKVEGVVKRIFVEEGDSVRANQVVAKLDDEQFELEFLQSKSKLEKLSSEFQRGQSLFEDNIISKESYEKVKSEYHTQKAAYDLAKLKLNYTEIRAPITGIVSQRFIKVGNMVKLHQPTFSITDFDPLLAVLHVPEREMSKLRVGFPGEITADALPDSKFPGKILRISPIVDAGTGTFKVTVEIIDKTRKLKPGMFTRVFIIYDTHEDTLLVPKGAVLSEDMETSVFVIRKDIASKQNVETGYENSTHVEILSGLNVGDTIVTTGLSSLKDGSKITVVK